MEDESRLDFLKNKRTVKLEEIASIDSEIEEEENMQFQHLIGKYLKLATTCCFRVDEIYYCDNNYIHVGGLEVFYSKGEFTIETNGSESIPRDTNPVEITEEKFLAFMNMGIDCVKDDMLKAVNI